MSTHNFNKYIIPLALLFVQLSNPSSLITIHLVTTITTLHFKVKLSSSGNLAIPVGKATFVLVHAVIHLIYFLSPRSSTGHGVVNKTDKVCTFTELYSSFGRRNKIIPKDNCYEENKQML